MSEKIRLSGAIALACVLAGPSASLFAQEQQEAQEAGMLEEIIVTAQYREQSVQDVPIAISAFSGAEVERAGITDLESIYRLAPDFVAVDDQNITRLSLRGIGSQSNDEAQDQAMTVNIDGEYINRGRVLNAAMFDIERIEVLRGPQGTLYGRNSTAGALNVITRRPSVDRFEGHVSGDLGNYSSIVLNGALNVPMGDSAAVRFAFQSAEHDGYNEHPNFPGEASGEQDTISGRVGLLFEPTDRLSIYAAVEVSNTDTNSNTYASIDFNQSPYRADELIPGQCSGVGWETYAAFEDGSFACIPTYTMNQGDIDPDYYEGPITGTLGSVDIDTTALRGEVNYETGGGLNLTYRVGYRTTDVALVDALPDFIFYRPNTDTDTLSNEFRINGETDGGIFWQTGVFWFQEEIYAAGSLYSPFINIPPVGNNGAYINGFYRPDYESDSKAVFAQVEIPFADRFTAVIGARYTDDDKSATMYNQGFGFNFGDPADIRPIEETPPSGIRAQRFTDSEPTWTLGLNYDASDATMYYAKVSKGYKAGGFDFVGSYESETVIAYEGGVKNNFDTFTLNVNAFYYDYEDLQASVLIDTTVGGQIFNAGDSEIWGVEAQFDTWLTDNDRLSATANYLSAEYKNFDDASIPVQCVGGCAFNALPGSVTGNTPPNAPEWIFTLGYEHVFNLAGGSTLTAGAFSRYKDDYYNTIFNYNDGRQDAYTQTDVTLEWASASGDWRVLAYLRNLEDERQITYATFISAGPADAFNYSFGAPQTYGVRVSYDF